jgi:hypothetical protein
VFVLVGVVVFCAWLVPVFFTSHVARKSDPQTVRLVAPLVLLLMCGLTLAGGTGDRAISFTQGEVNFLFPGPFTRRELLLYKLARTGLGVLGSGLILSLVLLQHAGSWPAAASGGVLIMGMVQLLTLAVLMAAQAVGARAYSVGRRVVLLGIIAAAVVVIAPAVRQFSAGGFRASAEALQRSQAARVMLSPFTPFVRAFTAQSPRELALWGVAAAAIDLALLALVIRLDADYREAALSASQRMFDRMQRVRRGIMVPHAGGGGGEDGARARPRRGPRLRVPMLPWLRGAGPTAWRQMTAALRTSRYMLLMLLLLSLGIVPALFAGKQHYAPALACAAWLTVFLTMMLKFDFRAELDQMAWLKALPLRPTATAAGQLATPVFVLTVAQTLLLGSAAVLAPASQRVFLLVALPFLLPFNVLTIAVENLLFLLFPSRTFGAAPGDLGAMGRQIVFFLFKLIVLAVATGLAVGLGFAVGWLSGFVVAGVVTGFLVLCAVAVSLVPCVGWAYQRFDPSTDTPA